MMRESPCDDPLSCPGSNRSNPTTLAPRAATRHSAPLPIAPSPITATSTRIVHPSPPTRREPAELDAGAGLPQCYTSVLIPRVEDTVHWGRPDGPRRLNLHGRQIVTGGRLT